METASNQFVLQTADVVRSAEVVAVWTWLVLQPEQRQRSPVPWTCWVTYGTSQNVAIVTEGRVWQTRSGACSKTVDHKRIVYRCWQKWSRLYYLLWRYSMQFHTRLHCSYKTMPLDLLMFPSHSEFDTTVCAELVLSYSFLRTLYSVVFRSATRDLQSP